MQPELSAFTPASRVRLSVPFRRARALPAQEVASPRPSSPPVSAQCEQHLTQQLGARKVLLTESSAHAMALAALLLDVGPDDEVILPAFASAATAEAFAQRGATLVFADVRPSTLNLDERRLERLISPRTKALVVAHYAGVACRMAEIMALADAHGIAVVEDNVYGLFGRYEERPLGSFGAMATLGFRSLGLAEGGALVVNEEQLAHASAEMGRASSAWLANGLWAGLAQEGRVSAERHALWQRYRAGLAAWARAHEMMLPLVPAECEHPASMYYLIMPNLATRQAFIAHMNRHGIQTQYHYQPLHLSYTGQRFGDRDVRRVVAETVSDRLVRLPLFAGLSAEEQTRVIEAALAFTVVS